MEYNLNAKIGLSIRSKLDFINRIKWKYEEINFEAYFNWLLTWVINTILVKFNALLLT